MILQDEVLEDQIIEVARNVGKVHNDIYMCHLSLL